MAKTPVQSVPKKILVAYASRGGSTVGVAEAIGKTLVASGLEVDVLPMQEVHDLTSYRAVIAGSAIRIDRWLPEAMQFMQRHQQELSEKPFAAFLVCLGLASKTDQARKTASAYLQPVRSLVNPVSEGLFAGALNLNTIQEWGYRFAFRLVIALGFWSEGDYRDWSEIQQWAQTLPAKLLTERVADGVSL